MTLQVYKSASEEWVDITDYLKFGGLKITRNDIDAANSGRTMDGLMHRGRVASKRKLECSCRPLYQSETQILYALIEPEYIQVKYEDPQYGVCEKTFYSNNVPASFCIRYDSGLELWQDITFPLVER